MTKLFNDELEISSDEFDKEPFDEESDEQFIIITVTDQIVAKQFKNLGTPLIVSFFQIMHACIMHDYSFLKNKFVWL